MGREISLTPNSFQRKLILSPRVQHVHVSVFSFASWWLSCPGRLTNAEFESNMLCMLYMPCLCSQVIVWV